MTQTLTNRERIARRFHALSDETRVRIVDMLARGEKCVCELQEAVGAAQSRLSFHLKVLREAGLVNDRRQGRWTYYSLRPDALDAMIRYLEKRKPAKTVRSSCACGEVHEGACC